MRHAQSSTLNTRTVGWLAPRPRVLTRRNTVSSLRLRRVDKWLRFSELPERNKMEPKMDSPAFFRDYLVRRWSAGCHHVKTLLAELRKRGYTGCFSGLARFVSGWRTHEQGAAPKSEQQAATEETLSLSVGHHVSSRVAAALLVKPRPLNTGSGTQARCFEEVLPGFDATGPPYRML